MVYSPHMASDPRTVELLADEFGARLLVAQAKVLRHLYPWPEPPSAAVGLPVRGEELAPCGPHKPAEAGPIPAPATSELPLSGERTRSGAAVGGTRPTPDRSMRMKGKTGRTEVANVDCGATSVAPHKADGRAGCPRSTESAPAGVPENASVPPKSPEAPPPQLAGALKPKRRRGGLEARGPAARRKKPKVEG